MKIQPIVEGYGEVAAVPVLLRRLRDEAGTYELDVNAPIRRNRPDFVDESRLRLAVRIALQKPDCHAILILFDADDDCPKDLAPRIQAWAEAEAAGVPCAVVIANREYESWLLATIESLRGRRGIRPDAAAPTDPEIPRDAKGQLSDRMVAGRSYSETADQPALTAGFELAAAYARCRSFRRMVTAFGRLAAAAGVVLAAWPPAPWRDALQLELQRRSGSQP
jgi:hypothetical protein